MGPIVGFLPQYGAYIYLGCSQNYGPFLGYRFYCGTSYLGVPKNGILIWKLPTYMFRPSWQQYFGPSPNGSRQPGDPYGDRDSAMFSHVWIEGF